MNKSENDQLFDEILAARERVYALGDATPLQPLEVSGSSCEVWVKREDLGPIKAYKWRGAYNAMAALTEAQRDKGIVTASAGNHAQGVALAANELNCRAIIYMPRATPEVKRSEVQRIGAHMVEIRLVGDSYDEAAEAAALYCEQRGGVYVHPYDDLMVMGGQGTLADEVVMSGCGPFDRVYVAIGGGGLAAALSCWLKKYWPKVKIYGVEGIDQASMSEALEAGEPVRLDYVDVFCDGTAVRKVGVNTYKYCSKLLDGMLKVSNDDVCHAIRSLWESARIIPEPSGAMSLAGFQKHSAEGSVETGAKVLCIVSGANMDFAQLGAIAHRAGIGSKHRRFLRVPIPQGRGTLVSFLSQLPREISIIDLQYGMIDSDVQYPVLGLIGSDQDYCDLDEVLDQRGVSANDVSTDEDVDYRIINYAAERFSFPLFVNIEFPERAGSLLQFMEEVKDLASLCYFNYAYSGERVGRALVGMEFDTEKARHICLEQIMSMPASDGGCIRAVREVSDETFLRLTGRIRNSPTS
ncbi:MAG: pyridoxal-phosphate dependent enzyme [Akkermansiaceae bacterium]